MQTRQKLWLRSWGQLCELCQRTADKTVGYSCTVLFINDNSLGQVHSHICLIMLLKSGVALILFLFSLQASQIKELADLSLAGLRDVKYRRFLEVSRPITYSSSIRALREPLREPPRTKRSALFSTGVKVCPQESVKAVITSHQAYYKLRVCQEAIWEAFRIFFDRVPNSEEYMAWVYTCQYENLCMDDLARNFSNSQEHLDMVARRVAELGEHEGVLEETPEPGRDCTWTPPYIMIPMDHEVVIEDPSVIPENQQQYIVEFSVTVVDPIYSELLCDPAAPEYNDIIRELRDKMYHIFEKIPGFKEIHVLGFRAENVSVHYAAVFNSDTELSDQPEGYEMTDVETQRDLNAPKLKHIIVRALKQELSLPLDLNTLSFVAVFPLEEHINNIAHTAAPPIEENSLPTVAMIKHLEASGISPEAHTFTPFIPKVLTDIIWVAPEQTPAHPAGGTGTEVENILTTEEELSAEPATIEPGAVVHAVNSDPPSQTPEVQVIVPASQDHTVQGIEADTKVKSSPPAEKDEALEESSHQSGVPAPTVPTVKNILVPEETSENGTHAGTNQLLEEDSGSGLPSEADEGPYESTAAPAMRQASTPLMAAVDKSKELVVFFSLRVTNMMFTDNLFNKNSPEYKSLENTFLELLLPYLETNLTGFKALEILSFRNGSVIVNSKMKLNKAVPYNITEAVHCVLEDFCNSASNQLDIQIDSRSLEIEQADQTDPCKFLACNEFSRCMVNSWSGEAECQCDPGYSAVGDHPCQSTCALQPDFCLNGGLCEIIPGHGATCRCPVGKYWHYHGERCDELITLPLDTPLILTSLVGSLCLVGSIIGILIFINKKCIKPQKAVTLVHTLAPYAFENTLRVNPVFQNDDGFLPQVSTLPYPSSSASSQSQQFEQEHFASVENIHLSIEIPRQLYTTRSEKLVSDMVDFHHCISHSTTWRPSNKGRTCCLLRASENDCFEVTVV